MSSTARRRRRVLIAAGVAVSVALLILTFRNVSVDGLTDALRQVEPGYLLAALVIKGLMFAIFAVRTRVLIREIGDFRLSTLIRAHLLAFVVNNVVPLRAGELAKIGYLARTGGVAIASCVAVVLTERLIEMFVLCALLGAVLPAVMVDVPIGASFYLILGVSVATIAVAVGVSRRPELFVALAVRASRLFGRRLSAWVEKRAETFAAGLAGLRSALAVIAVIALSALFWGTALANITLVAWAVGVELPWYGAFVVLAFISFGLVVPSTPGNIGTYHFFAAAAMTSLGVDALQATTFAVVAHFIAVVPYTVVAVPILWTDFFKRSLEPDSAAPRADDAE